MFSILEVLEELDLVTDTESLDLFGSWYVKIISLYSQPHRHYHNLTHILKCLDSWNNLKHLMKEPLIVLQAILFHDIIYDPAAKNNENKSTQMYNDFCNSWNIPYAKSKIVFNMIEFTALHGNLTWEDVGETNESDTAIFLDIDMSILASDTLDYKEYAENIKKEYSNVCSELIYNKGRISFIKNLIFSNRKIFLSKPFEHLEDKARHNLFQELIDLEKRNAIIEVG